MTGENKAFLELESEIDQRYYPLAPCTAGLDCPLATEITGERPNAPPPMLFRTTCSFWKVRHPHAYTWIVCIIGESELAYVRPPVNRRLNITLPEQTVRMLDRAVSRGQRSGLIDQAVRRFINDQGRANLRKQLELGAKARSERDREIAEEWFVLRA